MNIPVVKSLALLSLSLLLLFATAAPVWAADPVTLELQAPKEAALGEKITVTAVLTDGKGAPIPKATIILWTSASFLSTESPVELDRAITDAQGKVTFLYQPRSENSVTLNASFSGNSRHAPAQSSVELTVQGSVQLYQETAGVQLPGIGVWLIVGILGGVWATYFVVMVLLTIIARDGARAPDSAGGRRG